MTETMTLVYLKIIVDSCMQRLLSMVFLDVPCCNHRNKHVNMRMSMTTFATHKKNKQTNKVNYFYYKNVSLWTEKMFM